jgi:Tol biopolymer transport system component
LNGQRRRLVTVKGKDLGQLGDDAIFIQGLSSIKFSPNGRYIAAFLASNSPSYNTAGMPLSIIDTNRKKRVTVGKGLGYPGWLAWSANSKRLAFIDGLGRSVTTNKRLNLAAVDQGRKVTKIGNKGLVDCRPLWLGKTVYFARATETETWDTDDKRVPGQQIIRWMSGKVTPVTTPGKQSDYPLSLSPDGRKLAFLRLSSLTRGELWMVDLRTGLASQILNKVPGQGGYYGNLYPDWISIYWLTKPNRQVI